MRALSTLGDAVGRWRTRRALRWAMDGVLVIAIVLAISTWQSRDLPRGEAPSFSLRSLQGELIDNSALLGKPTLVVFWAPWCTVCRLESPNISRVQSIVGGHGRVVSIAVEYDSVSDVEAYVHDLDVDYPVLLGGTTAARAFGVRAFPSAFFLDADGRISSATVGYTSTLGLLARLFL